MLLLLGVARCVKKTLTVDVGAGVLPDLLAVRMPGPVVGQLIPASHSVWKAVRAPERLSTSNKPCMLDAVVAISSVMPPSVGHPCGAAVENEPPLTADVGLADIAMSAQCPDHAQMRQSTP